MKNIVFVSGRLGGGGSERVLTLIANKLYRDGNNVSIITFTDYDNNYINECPVHTLVFQNDVDQILKLRNKIKEICPDVVIAFEYYVGMKTVLATLGVRARVIVSERNDPHKLDSAKIKRLLRNILYKRADLLVCQTEDAAKYFNNLGIRTTKIILNPIKAELPSWNLGDSRKIIINFCKLEKQKNLPMLIEAFKIVHNKHPEFLLHIYGNGSEKESLISLIKKHELENSIKIMPFANNIHEVASKCYMFVSTSDYEGLSNSMLESMAMGIPTVCTDCPIGGAHMMIEDGVNGVLVPVKDSTYLATKMCMLMEDNEKLLSISRECVKIREKLSLDNICEEWRNILNATN